MRPSFHGSGGAVRKARVSAACRGSSAGRAAGHGSTPRPRRPCPARRPGRARPVRRRAAARRSSRRPRRRSAASPARRAVVRNDSTSVTCTQRSRSGSSSRNCSPVTGSVARSRPCSRRTRSPACRGLRGGAVGDGGDVRRRPDQPSPRVGAVVGVLRHAGHRARVQGLQVERPQAGDDQDRLGVHLPGDRVRAEQAEIIVSIVTAPRRLSVPTAPADQSSARRAWQAGHRPQKVTSASSSSYP